MAQVQDKGWSEAGQRRAGGAGQRLLKGWSQAGQKASQGSVEAY